MFVNQPMATIFFLSKKLKYKNTRGFKVEVEAVKLNPPNKLEAVENIVV
jgi:hypothetical protein